MKTVCLLALALALAPACSNGGAGGGACIAAGATTCDKACSCATDGKCRIRIPSQDGGANSFLTLSSKDDCVAEYDLVCTHDATALTVDYGVCQAGLAGAMCINGGFGGPSEPVLDLPAACAPLW